VEVELRDYQERMIEEARRLVAQGKRRLLFFLPTGAGKTIQAIAMMKSAWEKGYRSVIFAHRRELVEQTARRFMKYGVNVSIIMAGHDFDPSAKLVVASFQTWESRRDWLDKEYQLVFFDEAHIGVARQKRIVDDILSYGINPVFIGLTATPMTNQGPGLGSVYEELVHGPSIVELQERGYLVPAEYYMMQPIDFDPRLHIPIKGDEYDAKEVFKWFRDKAIIGDVIQNWKDNFFGRPTIVFARSVEQSIFIAEQFGNEGIPAAHIDYRTPDKVRRRILEDFRAGNISILSSVDIFSEGFDMPDIEVAIIATPINSLPKYIQRVGRVLRPAPDKEKAIVVDHGGVLQQHGRVEDYIEWTLEPARPNRAIPAHAVKKINRERERRCPICGTTFRAGLKECPKCGYDFHRLPPGYAPPIIPATMVEYERAIELERKGIRKRCTPWANAPADKYQAWLELLKAAKANGWKLGFARILYYSMYCECPKYRYKNVYGDPPYWTTQVLRRYWTLQKYGHFKDAARCIGQLVDKRMRMP